MNAACKLLIKTARFCSCFRRRKAKRAAPQIRAPFSYSARRDVSTLPNLQDSCLEVLTEHIHQLDQAAVDSLPVDLAQRLFDSVSSKGAFTRKTLSLFKHHYLDSASLHGIPGVEDRWLTCFVPASMVQLDLSYCPLLTDKAVQSLSSFVKLEKLRLDHLTLLTDDGLSGLCGLEHLRDLSLKGCAGLHGNGCSYLTMLHRLTSLSFEMCSSLATGMKAVGTLTDLTVLNLGWCSRISSHEVGELRSLERLKILELSETRSAVRGLSKWMTVHQLRKLGLSGCQLQREEMNTIKKFSCLQELRLTRACFDPAHLEVISSLVHLKTLSLAFTSIRNTGLRAIASIQSLTELDLDSCRVTDLGITELTKLMRLRSLELADTSIRDPCIESIIKLTTLERLSLACTDIRGHALVKISKLARLTDLNLDISALSGNVMKHLSTLTALTKLDMFSAKVGDRSLQYLLPCTGIQSLEFCGGLITDVGCRTLSTLPNLTYVNLARSSGITNFGAGSLAQLTSLTSLNLSETSVKDPLLSTFQELKRLRSLSIRGTEVSADGVKSLMQQLPDLRVSGCTTL